MQESSPASTLSGRNQTGVKATVLWRSALAAWLLPAMLGATEPVKNPLLGASSLPDQYPPFDRITNGHFEPAFETGMAEQLREVDAIAESAASPTFENTIVALERSGQLLDRARRIFSNLSAAHTNPEIQALESRMAPRFSAHSDAIRLNKALFARIQELHQARDQLGLDAESLRLVERYHKDFIRAGAKLSAAEQTELRALNAELATLQTTFSQNVLKEVNASAIVIDSRAELAGLSADDIAPLEAAARKGGQEGKFVLRLQNTSGQPALASLENRGLRERIHRTSLGRNSRGGDYDNRDITVRIARLRARRAALLGYEHHAAFVVEEQTARTVNAVNGLLAQLAPPAVANARRDAAAMQAMIDAEGGKFALAAWDWAFYAEKIRQARHAFDESQLRPYFELNRVLRDGVFYAATRLYGITFHERPDLPIYHPDVQVFEVRNADGSPLALFLADLYARPSKRGGAWASAYVSQSGLLGTRPVIANHLNIAKPPDGEPTLLTFDHVNTMFHEFGHALHGMFSNVTYPRFSGTSVPRDFVEYPSQVNEMWATWPEVLQNYARHHQTGEPMPAELAAKLTANDSFNQGYKTTEYLAASLLDQAWHQLRPDEVPADPLAFESQLLREKGFTLEAIPPRYRTPYFSHSFSGGYAAGYYSYIWSEVLDADSVEWFRVNGGLTRGNGDRLREMILSRGGSEEAMDLYRRFRGGDPEIAHLLKRRSLDAETAAAETH